MTLVDSCDGGLKPTLQRILLSGQVPYPWASAEIKVFCFFSSEKKTFLFC
jgi:hypothetical protein